MSVFGSSLGFLVSTLGGIYLLMVLLRFLLQIARADFYNPISQSVVQVTEPMVRVFRSFIPRYRNIDLSSLLLSIVVQAALICALIIVYGQSIPSVGFVVTYAFLGTLYFVTQIYFFAILAAIIMSFVMMFSGYMGAHPLLNLVRQLTEPVMAPVRAVIPPLGGFDFSPIFVFFLIDLIQRALDQWFNLRAVAPYVVGI